MRIGMPFTKKQKARELMDADVSYLSLVTRGANGEPFRVMKSGGSPVVSVWISKSANQRRAKKILKHFGFNTSNPEKGDYNWIYPQIDQEGVDFDQIIVFKVSEGVAVEIQLGGDTLTEDEIGKSEFSDIIFKKDYAILAFDANIVLERVTAGVQKSGNGIVDSFRSHAKYISNITNIVPDNVVQLAAALRKNTRGTRDEKARF